MWIEWGATTQVAEEDHNNGGFIFAIDEYGDHLTLTYQGYNLQRWSYSNLDDSQWRTWKLEWQGGPSDTDLRVWRDNSLIFYYRDSTSRAVSSSGYVGFGARTGYYTNYHRIKNINVFMSDETTDRIRLSHGESGLVQVYYDNGWHNVCDDYFGAPEATVICQQLFGRNYYGCDDCPGSTDRYSEFSSGGLVGNPDNPIFDDLHCTGSESSLWDCPRNTLFNENCSPSESAWVDCTGIKLSHGRYGLVQVYYNGWHNVCDDYFGEPEATVICRQLFGTTYSDCDQCPGSTDRYSEFTSGYVGDPDTPIFDDLECSGSESSLWDCPRNSLFDENCSRSESAWVVCN